MDSFHSSDGYSLNVVFLKSVGFFLLGLIISGNRRRKDIKVTFLSFGLHAERFTHYFDIRFVKIYFGFKDYRVFAVSHSLPPAHLLY